MWNSLRNTVKKAVGASKPDQILRKLTGRDQFLQSEFRDFVRGLQSAGISLVQIDEFVARYGTYFDAQQERRQKDNAGFGHFKFDIHGDIARPVEMARILHDCRVPGLFLIMHRHALNDAWYGTAKMWDALKEIRDLGHEIGLHADPFHLITTYGDLYDGLEAALEDMTAHGFAVRAMTLHGDSRSHIKARKLQANDFFSDGFRKSRWDGRPPEGQEKLAEHVRRYKHRRLYKKYGIEYVADVNLVHQGKLIVESRMTYLSDNQRRLRIGHIAAKAVAERTLEAPDLFTITPEFTAEAAKFLVKRPFLALFHPQWFR